MLSIISFMVSNLWDNIVQQNLSSSQAYLGNLSMNVSKEVLQEKLTVIHKHNIKKHQFKII